MATETDTRADGGNRPTSAPPHRVEENLSIQHAGRQALEFLASLKITVVLFALAILLILFGTLAQVSADINTVLKEYFRVWVAWVDPNIFFPRSFFSGEPPQLPAWLQEKFPFPGGKTIGLLMCINLLAAHGIRFKIQAKGQRLFTGLGVILFGILTTWLVIQSGSSSKGFQTESLFEPKTLWAMLKWGLGVLWVGIASSLLKIESNRKLERWTIVGVTLALGAGLVYLFWLGDDFQLENSYMRILWQLIKAEVAALVLLAGCILMFKKRAGVVLLHAGVGLLMFNEMNVAMNHEEAQMVIREGETTNYVQHGGKYELAFIDRSGKQDVQVVVPASRLVKSAKDDTTIQDEQLPFDVKVLTYYKNSDLQLRYDPEKRGAWKYRAPVQADEGTGTDQDSKFDAPSAIVELVDKKSGESLGQYLVSLFLEEQEVLVGSKTYEIALRFKRTYKPYSMHLIDTRGDQYLGTNTAKNYSSEIQLIDKERNVKRDVKISMNNPLRYAGETFYQSGYHPRRAVFKPYRDPDTNLITGIQPDQQSEPGLFNKCFLGFKEETTLQVVTNVGWMIPYVACMIVATGMLAHFWLILLRFLNRRAAGQVAAGAVTLRSGDEADAALTAHARSKGGKKHNPADAGGQSLFGAKQAGVWFPLAICLLMAGWLAGKMFVRSPGEDKMNVYDFGKLPIVSRARVKPYDSYARNNLRMISNKEEFKDSNGDKQPAIVWMLDTLARPERAIEHRVFRIENLEVLRLLSLERRPGSFRYSYKEIVSFRPENGRKLGEAIAAARAVDSKKRTFVQRKVMELGDKLSMYQGIRRAHMLPPKDIAGSQSELLKLVDGFEVNPRWARPVPASGDDSSKWDSLTVHTIRYWIRQYAKAHQLKTLREVAEHMIQAPLDKEARQLQERKVGQLITRAKQLHPRQPPQVLFQLVLDASFAQLENELKALMGGETLSDPTAPEAVALINALVAYRDGNAKEFNAAVSNGRTHLAEDPPADYVQAKVGFESWFNHFAPYYHVSVLYVVAFILSVLAWLGWSRPLTRAAFGLVGIAFVIHTAALLSRMYISDRWGVVVTNLYSSAVFIGWATCLFGLVFEAVHRIGIGAMVASFTGFSSLWIAHLLSFDGDTISVMQAVLDTNFWLATHVTTITLGYSATFVAGGLGILYIFLGLFSRALTEPVERTLLRMIYGSLCFAIFFSFVGTVLGGLWADDSWGRFWGWDPKENGALIIVIWNALVLHARWDGMVKTRGLAVLAVGGAIATAWSWFGVNLLGAGLHSYGFQEGVGMALGIAVLGLVAIIGLGCAPRELWTSFRARENQSAA